LASLAIATTLFVFQMGVILAAFVVLSWLASLVFF
jgi:hypothetical protein